jgi:hypothetical protein
VTKNGFHFLEEYNKAEFLDLNKTKLYILSTTPTIRQGKISHDITPIKTIVKPLTEEKIEQLIGG